MSDNKNRSAYPVVEQVYRGNDTLILECTEPGLTAREKIAAMAMQGILASYHDTSSHLDAEKIAKMSVEFADALINELSKS